MKSISESFPQCYHWNDRQLENKKAAPAKAGAAFWRRGSDSNAQCLAAHHISNVAPYH